MLDPLGLYEYRAALHVHSRYSDGTGTPAEIIAEAKRAGLDVLWLTDHDNRRALQDPGGGYYGHLLFLVGAEITPPTNHYLVFGPGKLVSAQEPLQSIIDAMREGGSLGIIAHPDDPGNRTAGLPSYRWSDRNVDGFAGFEIWNHISDWARQIHSLVGGVWAALRPFSGLREAWPQTLALWDAWGARRRVVGTGGADAHAAQVGRWPARLTLFPYRVSFSGIRTHFYTTAPLDSDWQTAERQLLDALSQGRVAVVNAARGKELGFRLWAEKGGGYLAMGSEFAFEPGWTLRGLSPVPVCWDVVRNGAIVARKNGTLFRHPIADAGVWRVTLRRAPNDGVWVYSNPIYAR